MREKLRAAREKSGLSQKELADKLGYSSSQFVSNWERSLALPPMKKWVELEKLIGISVKELAENARENLEKEMRATLGRKYPKRK